MNQKILFFDIDGTIVNPGQSKVVKGVEEAMNLAHQNGHIIVLATGRAPYFINENIIEVVKPDYLITINGQLVLDKNKKAIVKHSMDEETKASLIEESRKLDLSFAIKFEEKMIAYNKYDYFKENYLHGRNGQFLIDGQDTKIDEYNNAMDFFYIGNKDIVMNLLSKYSNLTTVSVSDNEAECYPANYSKASGIKEVLEILKLKEEDCFSFGDGENDVEMLQVCTGISLKDASKKAKEAAKYITDNLNDYGIYNAMKHFKLI